ncbi:MAG: hypothetical protein IPG71_07305 [bacterium]|nr:hypothetical protein [bacterium]
MSGENSFHTALSELFRIATAPDLEIHRIASFVEANGIPALAQLQDAETIRRRLQVSVVAAHKLAALTVVYASTGKAR